MSHADLAQRLADAVLVFDGGIGSEFYQRGFFLNVCYEHLCLQAPEVVRDVHRQYAAAGANVLTTNSYGANARQLAKHGLADRLADICRAAVSLAREAGGPEALIAGSVGPVGDLGLDQDVTENQLVAALATQVAALAAAGADFILFETLPSRQDVARACRAAERGTPFPFVLSLKVDAEGESPRGETLAVMLEPLATAGRRPTALGLNCGGGASELLEPFAELRRLADYPLVVRPNAGQPRVVGGRTIYLLSPEYFATYGRRYVDLGARAVGGCCGVGPAHIAELARSLRPALAAAFSRRLVVKPDEAPLQPPVPTADKSRLGAKLAAGQWVTSVEILPPRGHDLDATVAKARECRAAGVDAINIPDGPRASSRLSPLITAHRIQEQAGLEPVLHVCCRDQNLIRLQADLLGCAAEGLTNLLFITGDPPKLGDYAFATGVFDVDSIGLVRLQARLNRGVDAGGKAIGKPTRALIGVGADPNALDFPREVRRTREKIEAGAEFIITQPVFAVEPLRRFLDAIAAFRVPLLAGIWPLASYSNAEFMRHEVPGVTVPDEVMRRMAAATTKDAQRAEGIRIARESVAGLRDCVQGVQVSAPFGNVATALAVLAPDA